MIGIFDNLTSIEGECFIQTVKVLGRIGAGNSAVFMVVDIESQTNFAMKEIVIKDQIQYLQVKKEIHLLDKLSTLDQDFVVKMHKYMICQQNQKNEFHDDNHRIAYILMEMGQASLSKYIELQISQGVYLTLDQILKIMTTTIQEFAFLQEQSIAHQDIKPENILLIDAQDLHIKVCDIGSGQEITDNNDITRTITGIIQQKLQGTLPFLAPEIIEGYQQQKIKLNAFKADVFSLGLCFLYTITFQKMNSRNRRDLSIQVYREIIKEWTRLAILIVGENQIITQLLQQMLMFDVNKRVDFIQLNEELNKNSLAEPQNLSKTLNLLDQMPKIKLQTQTVDLRLIQAPQQLSGYRRQQSANKLNHQPLIESGQRIPNFESNTSNFQKEPAPLQQLNNKLILSANTNTKKSKFSSLKIRVGGDKKLPQVIKQTSTQDQAIDQIKIVSQQKKLVHQHGNMLVEPLSAKLKFQSKKIYINTGELFNLQANHCTITKVSNQNDLLEMEGNTYGLWLEGIQELESLKIIKFIQGSCQLQKMYIKFGQGVKLIDQTIVLTNNFTLQLKALIFEVQSSDENLWKIILLTIECTNNSLQHFEILVQLQNMNYQWLELISQCLSKCQKLISINISIHAQGINQGKVHKQILSQFAKFDKLEELSIKLPSNNLVFLQPQWTFNDKLRTLVLDYSQNPIGKSLNFFSLALGKLQILFKEANLSVLNLFDLNLANIETNQKDLNFLIVQMTKLVSLQDISLNFDSVNCFNDLFVSVLLSALLKLPQLKNASFSFVLIQLSLKAVYECLHFFDKLYSRSTKAPKQQFSLRIDRIVSKNEIIKYSVNKKLLLQFKIDFLIQSTESLQILYLRNQEERIITSSKYPQVCNTGLNLITSPMNICVKCSDKYSPILQKQVIICDQCAFYCHTHKIVSQPQQILKRAQSSTQVQRHNIIKNKNHGPCDCYALGKCKLNQPTQCSTFNSDQTSLQMCFKSIGDQSIFCLWCRKNCYQEQKVQQLYPAHFKCSCLIEHKSIITELQQI